MRIAGIATSIAVLNTALYAQASCPCVTVDSFEDLKATIEGSDDALIRLCPFSVTKENIDLGIEITKEVHIMCAKESREDVCEIMGIGNAGSDQSKQYEVFLIDGVDNVWFQGLTFKHVKKGAIRVKGDNFKIIDSVFENCQSPPKASGAVVEIMEGSTATIIDSTFHGNEGGAVQNQGFLTVTHCDFIDNSSTPLWISNDETENRGGGVGGAILNAKGGNLFVYSSTFVDNVADRDGPAIWSYTNDAIDLGANCGTSNRIVMLQSDPEVVLGVCDGIYYKVTSESKGNLCATFGGECTE